MTNWLKREYTEGELLKTLSPYYAKKEYKNSPIYRNFVSSIKSPATKKAYGHKLLRFYLSRPDNQSLTLEDIIKKDPKTIEYEIIDILYNMKEKQHLSYSTIQVFLAVIMHFFEINDINLNRRKLSKFKGDNVAKFEYRSYTHEEIQELISTMDERGKASVLLMAATGMRIGALPEIKLKHLKRWNIDNQGNYVYQIVVYANSPKSKYTTFCTPEAAKAIDEYLEFRNRHGENLKHDKNGNWTNSNNSGETYLFIKQFDKVKHRLLHSEIGNSNLHTSKTMPIIPKTLANAIILRLEEMGSRNRMVIMEGQASSISERQSIVGSHRNEIHPCHSLRIFAVTNMQRSKVDKTIREMLVGHSTGLDKAYYKPQDEEILQEYLKAVDLLTINNENRLRKEVDFYKQRADKLSEMAARVQRLEEKWASN